MPEMHFTVEWPNGKRERCYSPSYIIEEFLSEGRAYPVSEFIALASAALLGASERVRQRYGFVCSSALDQLREIQRSGEQLTEGERSGDVKVICFEKHPPRDARAQPEEPGQ